MQLGAAPRLHILPGIWQLAPYRAASLPLGDWGAWKASQRSFGSASTVRAPRKTVALMPCPRGAHPAEAFVGASCGVSLLAAGDSVCPATSFTPSLLSNRWVSRARLYTGPPKEERTCWGGSPQR